MHAAAMALQDDGRSDGEAALIQLLVYGEHCVEVDEGRKTEPLMGNTGVGFPSSSQQPGEEW